MLKNQLIFLLFLLIQCQDYEDNIIGIPLNKDHEEIKTKNGTLEYHLSIREDDAIGFNAYCGYYDIEYKIEKMKNLKMLSFGLYRRIYHHMGENKDKVVLTYSSDFVFDLDEFNEDLCQLFYETKYIDKQIFSIGKNMKNEFFKYFGGTPKYLIENLNKFTFTKNDTLTEIEIIFNEKNKYKLNLNSSINHKIEFKDDSHLICLSQDIFSEFKKLLLDQYKETKYRYTEETEYQIIEIRIKPYELYDLTPEQKSLFPQIKFKIGNIIISLNKKDLIYEDSTIRIRGETREENIHNYLFIKNTPCDNNILGLKVLEKFEVREHNLETNELNLYLEKNNNFIVKDNMQKLDLNSYSYSFITFIILLFMVFVTIIMLFVQHPKNKNIVYFNYDEI